MILNIIFWVFATPVILILIGVIWLGVLAIIGNVVCGGGRRN